MTRLQEKINQKTVETNTLPFQQAHIHGDAGNFNALRLTLNAISAVVDFDSALTFDHPSENNVGATLDGKDIIEPLVERALQLSQVQNGECAVGSIHRHLLTVQRLMNNRFKNYDEDFRHRVACEVTIANEICRAVCEWSGIANQWARFDPTK